MLISNTDALKKLNSPGNLINKRSKAMSLFVAPRVEEKEKIIEEVKVIAFNPFAHKEREVKEIEIVKPAENLPSSDDLISDSDRQIKLSLAHDSALSVLTSSLEQLKNSLPEIKADRLPSVIAATSKVVEGIRKERAEASKNGKDKEVHYHFYTPSQKKLSDFEVIDVTT